MDDRSATGEETGLMPGDLVVVGPDDSLSAEGESALSPKVAREASASIAAPDNALPSTTPAPGVIVGMVAGGCSPLLLHCFPYFHLLDPGDDAPTSTLVTPIRGETVPTDSAVPSTEPDRLTQLSACEQLLTDKGCTAMTIHQIQPILQQVSPVPVPSSPLH